MDKHYCTLKIINPGQISCVTERMGWDDFGTHGDKSLM